MSKALSLTYGDAVRLLTDDEGALRQLDQLLGLGLLAAAPFAPAVVLPLFEAKGELVSRLTELTAGLKDRMMRASDFDRQCLLTAAHAVIVMASFIEELSARLTELDSDGKWRKEIHSWDARHRTTTETTGNESVHRSRLIRIVNWSRCSLIEPPTPTRPMEKVADNVRNLYQLLSRDALAYVKGLARWDELNESRRETIEVSLIQFLPTAAVRRYHGNYVRLAGKVPEFLAWILVNDTQATRKLVSEQLKGQELELRNVQHSIAQLAKYIQDESAALASIPQIVDDLRGRTAQSLQEGPQAANTLAIHHRLQQIVLSKPLLRSELADDLPGLTFPPVINGYINPYFRMVEIETSNASLLLAQENWWRESTTEGTALRPIRDGLAAHLVSHLTTSRAMSVPLVILGHPGSGKSLFSRVVAAQLPPERYLVVRVELRHVDPSASVAEQVDASLRRESNGAYGWRELSDGTGKLTRIIILDGLDELLQLSSQEGLGRYLERVQDFQEKEDALEHPTAVIVTARTLVMDRIYVPPGTVALKLEDFNDDQINTWLSIWNQTNQPYFTQNRLQPCTADTIAPHRNIAGQPLLLMMLALYDADENALHTTGELTQADLYESLFRRFARREVGKGPEVATRTDLLNQQVEERLEELSAIALGLFNRGRKFITREEVELDLGQLGIRRRSDKTIRRNITSDMAISQFFFLYKAEIVDSLENVQHSYEFLHTTFGEFLVARALTRALTQVGKLSDHALAWDADALPKTVAQYLAPYLAHRPMIAETQLVNFLASKCATRPGNRHPAVAVLLESLGVLLSEFRPTGDYRPRSLSTIAASAVWSLNLLLVTLIADGGSIDLTSDLLGPDLLLGWRRLARLWKSQLEPDDWDAAIQFFDADKSEDETARIQLSFNRGHEEVSIASSQYPARAEAVRLLLEARLTLDADLEASTAVWIGVLDLMPPKDVETNSKKLLVSQAINFALGSDFAPATSWFEFLPKLTESLQSWARPFSGVGPAGWTDSGLMDLATLFRSAEDDDHSGVKAQMDLLCSVLYELLNRGYPDIAEQMLRNLHSIPSVTNERTLLNMAFMLELSDEFGIDTLTELIVAEVEQSASLDQTIRIVNREVLERVLGNQRPRGRRGSGRDLAYLLRRYRSRTQDR